MRTLILILVSILSIPLTYADSVLTSSERLDDFSDFLSSRNVRVFPINDLLANLKNIIFELRQGEAIKNGCRFKQVSNKRIKEKTVQQVIAQDMYACQRLILIGNPRSSEKNTKPPSHTLIIKRGEPVNT